MMSNLTVALRGTLTLMNPYSQFVSAFAPLSHDVEIKGEKVTLTTGETISKPK